jgi:pimeloyl-ACP methyl ester carboxylesterase
MEVQELTKKELLIEGSLNQKPITADITYLNNGIAKPIILFAHGFKGFKDWGPWSLLSEKAALEGFCFLKFNFSYNGVTPENLNEITDKEAFGYNNFSREVEDIDRLLTYLELTLSKEIQNLDLNRIYLIGHSRGGGISIIKAAEDARIKKLATWASVHDFASRFTEAELTYWKTHGVVYVKNSRTGEDYPMYYQFAEDFSRNGDRFLIARAMEKVWQPMLIIHGTNDETVNINAAFQLHQWKPESKLFILNKANHTFGARHPHMDKSLPQDLELALEKTLTFFND